jgi:iron complex outermembrane receptor protein
LKLKPGDLPCCRNNPLSREKEVSMKALFWLLLLVLFAATLPAAERNDPTLPPVLVTATRLRDIDQPVAQVPGKVIVITAEEIEQLGASTIQEVLQHQTGIVLYDAIGNAFQSSVDLRGFNGQPVPVTSVFVDGVRVNEPDFNSINFDLIPIESIDRLEILPGTATVFGRNALGGVINITTKRGRRERPHIGFDLGAGSYARQRYSLSSDGPLPLKNFDYLLTVTRELSDGFRYATDARITRLFGKAGYRFGESTDAILSYTHVQDHLKQAGSLPGSFLRAGRRRHNLTPGDFADSNLDLIGLNVRQKLPAAFSLAVNGFLRNHDQQIFVRGLSSNSNLDTDTLSAGGIMQISHEGTVLGKKNVAVTGLEYGHNRFETTSTSAFICCPGDFITEQSTRENVVGVFFTDSLSIFDSLIVNAGFRYDWDRLNFTGKTDPTLSGTKEFKRFSPKTGLTYTPVENLSFSFNYSEGLRVPTVQEIFALGPFGSNLTLGPMKSRNFETGFKAKPAEWLEAAISLFYMPVRDEILFIATDPLDPFSGRNENISRTLRQGMEVSFKLRPGKWIDAFINYTLTKATFETDFFIPGINAVDPPRPVTKGDELPLVPRHRVGLGVNIRPLDRLTFSLFGNYVGEQYQLRDEPNTAKKLADYFVLNSRIAYEWREWMAHVTLNNLTDRRYSSSGILVGAPFNESFRVPAPGINVFAGLSFRY